VLLILAAVLSSACAGGAGGKSVTLNGAGATFPYPLLSKWISEYNKTNSKVKINYQSIGSGAGIQQATAKTVDFGASDAPLSTDEASKAPGLLHLPETIGAVVITYNLPGVPSGLKLTGEVVADIFLGTITKWNDPKITNLNPDFKLPDQNIVVAHRSDGSGTTYVFTEYLANVSRDWTTIVGKGKSVNWPAVLGGKGNEGVAGIVSQTPNSMGYVELTYALQNKMSYARIKNRAGNFIEPTLNSVSASASRIATSLPRGDADWSKVTIVNPEGPDSYPISSLTYILVYKDQSDKDKGKALADFLWWCIHDGQKFSADLNYVPLPTEIVSLDEKTISMMNYQGQTLHSL